MNKRTKAHTLAKKLEAVHSTTTTRSREIPRVRLAVPPNRDPFALEEVFMSRSAGWSIGDSVYSNGDCCRNGEVGGDSGSGIVNLTVFSSAARLRKECGTGLIRACDRAIRRFRR